MIAPGKRKTLKRIAESKLIPSFAIRAEWLWLPEEKRPTALRIVQHLLADKIPR